MRILFLGDVVGISGCSKLMNNLLNEIKLKKIDFVIVNGENAAHQGVGLSKEICNDFFNCGVDVITTGNHVWDQKEIMEYIDKRIDYCVLKIFLNQRQEKVLIFILLKKILKLEYSI